MQVNENCERINDLLEDIFNDRGVPRNIKSSIEESMDILKKSDVVAADVRFALHLFYAEPMPALRLVTQ